MAERSTPPKSAAIAALLSFVFPGLGHLYLGKRRAAVVFALPALVVLAVLVIVALSGIDAILASLVTPSGTLTILILILLTAAWRIVAMVDAVLVARRRDGLGPLAVGLVAVLVVGVVVVHGYGAYVAYAAYEASSQIFVAGGPDAADAPPTTSTGSGPLASGSVDPAAEFLMTPDTTPSADSGRITFLLTGIDSASTRTISLNDTMLVVSVNPTDKSVAMLSFPRDISNFPMYDGRKFTGKLNSLMTWARNHPNDMPDGPFPTLVKELGYLSGVPINYFAAVNLEGFSKLIDQVGGVTVDNPRPINDPRYAWLDGTYGFYLDAGKVHLNGRRALAYVRSRQGAGDSDFTRAARQQQLLLALRDQLLSPKTVTDLPGVIRAAGDTIRTNVPPSEVERLITLARTMDTADIDRYVLGPPYAYHPPTSSTGGVYTLKLDMDKLAKLSVKLFGDDSRYAGD